ncbi:quinol oxidase [Candidatus Marsarchaeota G2 archaeon ECH_B_2]|jgi:thiosulfate dehydrogenase [quinone] large subunit|uniref:Quinol oxidase n=3 Tax=Candidatus Marsarchaeota group 2 TaxID=2203771 RepID=A0A2R6BB34_9ARCH|nr:MAG: quinol oxidase [Candidatus Marsarchaeota G2 archaeon ECH_B_2]PSO00611.1 MAG: quinol oxidase [Candidatus Marsarchaeota G2 archaeon ECH_B_3]PSO03207.1 MAG: quinol oxidase [Candidatus Marsarchaeota G2 archaeon ECH_B_1]
MEKTETLKDSLGSYVPAAYMLPLRIGVGWMWLDGGLRKLVLAPQKVNPASASFVLGKFVTFLPHSGPFEGFLKFMLENPSLGSPFLIVYSVLELVVGTLLIIGLFTRLAGFGGALMAASLAPAFWLGSTCEDEWQIGSLLVAGGVVLMLSAAGRRYGLDSYLYRRFGDRGVLNTKLLRHIKLW